MSYIDIFIVAVLFIAAIVGLKKGFVGQIGGVLATVLAVVLTILTYKQVTAFLMDSSVFTIITDKVQEIMISKNAAFGTALADEAGVKAALTEMGIPELLHSIFLDLLGDLNIECSIAKYVGDMIAGLLITDVGTFCLFLIYKFVLKIFFKIFKKVKDAPIIGGFDRLLGMIWDLAIVSFVICVIFLLLVPISNMGGIGESIKTFITTDLKLDGDGFSIGKLIYNNNPLSLLISKFNIKDIFSGILNFGK